MKTATEVYDLIATHYSELFPLDQARVDFICSFSPSISSGAHGRAESAANDQPRTHGRAESVANDQPRTHGRAESVANDQPRILDVGCATGELALALAARGARVTGIDSAHLMIRLAREKAETRKVKVEFLVQAMQNLGQLPLPGEDLILCFGNTLPHLVNQDEVHHFFRQVEARLKPGGYFLFQILNYDKILALRQHSFPALTLPAGVFRRRYTFTGSRTINFTFEWEERDGGSKQEATTSLLPLARAELRGLLEQAGFQQISMYGDYRKNPTRAEDAFYLFAARKLAAGA